MTERIAFYGAAAVGIWAGIEFSGPKWFIVTPEYIQTYATTDWNRGVRADGQVFFTTPLGLFIQSDEIIPLESEPTEDSPVGLPTADWLYNSLKTGQYTSRNMDILLYNLWPLSTMYKEEQKGIARKHLENKKEILVQAGIAINDTTLDLITRIQNFDYGYAYIDETSKWRFNDDRFKALSEELADYPALADMFSKGFRRHG